jgi:polar amino acid transport system substrate-binding protein
MRFIVALLLAISALMPAVPLNAQPAAGLEQVPNFWDPRRRMDRPDMTRVSTIRFLVEDDFPPFNFLGSDGQPIGFNVDLARAICVELRISCTVQVRRWDTLLESLDRNAGDAVIASLAVTRDLRRRYEITDRYMETPARFVMRSDTTLADARPETLAGRTIAVVVGTAHEAYLRDFYRNSQLRPYRTLAEARLAVRDREVDVLFADGIGLAFWLNGTASEACCRFLDGAFTESRYFGEGMAVVLRRGNDPLRLAINFAMQRLWDRGVYAEIYLKYFPIGVY